MYLRVSTVAQADKDYDPEGYSIPAQREACERKASVMDAEIVGEFMDRGESARSADRPKLQEMLKFLKESKNVDFVIVHKVDRLARSREDDVYINLSFQKAGAKLVSASENIDESPSGQLLHGIMATVAEFYSNNLATEVKKGMSRKAKTGGTPGRVPLGYKNVRTVIENRIIRTVGLDEERAPFIQQAFELYSTGQYSLAQLADLLSSQGFRTVGTRRTPPRMIYRVMLSKVLTNAYYCGFVSYNDALFDGRHEALISRELFENVQKVLRLHMAGEKRRRYLHYLKSTVYCQRCQGRLCLASPNQKHLYFFCANRKRRTCDLSFLSVPNIEVGVTDYYEQIQLTRPEIEQVVAAVHAYFDNSRQLAEVDEKRQNVRILKLEQEKSKLMEAYYAGAIAVDLLAKEQQRITLEIEQAQASMDSSKQDYKDIAVTFEQAVWLLQNCAETYRKAPDDARRLMNQALFEAVYVDEVIETGKAVGANSALAEPFKSMHALAGRNLAKTKTRPEGLAAVGSVSKAGQSSEEDYMVRLCLQLQNFQNMDRLPKSLKILAQFTN
jgi:site-specific DNA recombinase